MQKNKLRSDTTSNMTTPFSSMLNGMFLDTSQASSDDHKTSEQNTLCDECHWHLDLPETQILLATREAHLTLSTTVKQCEAP